MSTAWRTYGSSSVLPSTMQYLEQAAMGNPCAFLFRARPVGEDDSACEVFEWPGAVLGTVRRRSVFPLGEHGTPGQKLLRARPRRALGPADAFEEWKSPPPHAGDMRPSSPDLSIRDASQRARRLVCICPTRWTRSDAPTAAVPTLSAAIRWTARRSALRRGREWGGGVLQGSVAVSATATGMCENC